MKIKITFITLIILTNLKAQDPQYNANDSVTTFVGFWTGKPIIALRDSNPLNPAKTYFFKVFTPNVQLTRFKGNTRNDGTPTSMAWFDNEGYLKCSSFSPTNLIAGNNISLERTGNTYTISAVTPTINSTLYSVSTPTALTYNSRIIAPLSSPVSYSVSVRTHVDLSATITANVVASGFASGTIYVETQSFGSSTWVFRGNICKIVNNIIGFSSSGNSYGLELNSGDKYRIIVATTTSGTGNTITYSFDGGSFYTTD